MWVGGRRGWRRCQRGALYCRNFTNMTGAPGGGAAGGGPAEERRAGAAAGHAGGHAGRLPRAAGPLPPARAAGA
eukprot:1179007-Prorocentrum_minimum.AAC.1